MAVASLLIQSQAASCNADNCLRGLRNSAVVTQAPLPDSKRAFGTLELPGGPATVGSVAMDVTVVTLVTVNALTDTGQVVVCGMGVVVGVVVGVTVVVLGLRHAQALDILAALPSHPDA
ncbi:hypothetical protein EV126DRAFT_507617 [Verticillium dahliae]|nr:hypothetical protein EV126DRAFT_507617 [Verticillium dahliae]